MEPDGDIHSSHLRVHFANQVLSIPRVLPLEGWTSSLQQLPSFNYGCLYARLVTDSKTIAENQWSTAAATFGAGIMKHNEEGYCLFPDDHVWIVGFWFYYSQPFSLPWYCEAIFHDHWKLFHCCCS